ncbi:MAG TPA: ABC transporter substrate-binding protein [Burkholderiaceae bacterium]|nr:ABC transporter substrate-binding protein [Burkholderiaceae bacterium]
MAGTLSGVNAQTLKIGVIASLTGPAAPFGMATAGGPKIVAAEINAKGGLEVGGKKYQVEVIAYDDQYKAADAVAAYNRLVKQNGVKYLIVMSSASTVAVKEGAEADKVITFTSSVTPKAFDENTKYMFRLYSPPNYFIAPLSDWMRTNLKERRLVIVNPNDESGWAQTEASVKVYKKDGFDVIGTELYERSAKDFQSLLTKVLALKPEIIDLSGTVPGTAGLIVRQARELGYKGVFTQTGAGGPKEIVAGAGRKPRRAPYKCSMPIRPIPAISASSPNTRRCTTGRSRTTSSCRSTTLPTFCCGQSRRPVTSTTPPKSPPPSVRCYPRNHCMVTT